MISKRGGFIIQRHNELRDLEAESLNMVCNDVETEPVLHNISGERFHKGSTVSPDARLDLHARGFWEPQRSAFFDVRICHPNDESWPRMGPECMRYVVALQSGYHTRRESNMGKRSNG